MRKCFRPECEEFTTTKFCSFKCNTIYQNSIRVCNLIEYNKSRLGTSIAKYNSSPKLCIVCNNIIPYEKRENKFCNSSCAATFNNKEVRRHGNATINKPTRVRPPRIVNTESPWFVGKYIEIVIKNCLYCDKLFCKQKCKETKCCSKYCGLKYGSKMGGRKSAQVQSESRRSKNEIYFSELCQSKHEILTNIQMFNGWDADVILPNLKIAVLWNGNWHLKKITIKHSVKQVQNRDRIKIKNIVECGYIPYIIEDEGKYKPIFVENMFELFSDFVNNIAE